MVLNELSTGTILAGYRMDSLDLTSVKDRDPRHSQTPLYRGIKPVRARFEVFMAVTMKNGILWDVTLCGSCKN
jgi:hypothetical protein